MVAVRLRPSIILLGDSLTQFAFGQNGQVGWAGLLAQEYTRRADVLNRGFQGYNSKMLLNVLPDLLLSQLEETTPVLFWTIYLGANDAALGRPSDQSIPLPDFANNLHQIVHLIRDGNQPNQQCEDTNNNKEDDTCQGGSMDINDVTSSSSITTNEVPIIFLTPPSCDVQLWQSLDPDPIPDNENSIYRSYGQQVQEVAQSYSNCSVVDTWSLLGGDSDPATLSQQGYHTDGVHLTDKGNRVVFEGLMDVIRNEYPHLKPMTDGNGQFGKEGVPMEGKIWWMYRYEDAD